MQYDALGRRTTLTDATGTTRYTYDALGRMTQVAAPHTGVVGYAYNARGQRTRLTYLDGTTVLDYAYQGDGHLASVQQGGIMLASYAYDSVGRLHTTTRANGAVTTATYDGADRLTDLRTTVGSQTVSQFTSTLDRSGQRTQVAETLGSTTRTITSTYDGLQRLLQAQEQPGNTHQYAYDRAGNRTGVWVNGTQTVSHTFNAAHQVVGWTYDAAGNLLGDGVNQYTYDALNRLTSANGTISQDTGDGPLVAQTTQGLTTRYSQDLAAPLPQVLTTGGANYLYGHERLVRSNGPGDQRWELHDGLGSVRGLLDEIGTLLDPRSSSAWGSPLDGAAPAMPLSFWCRPSG